MDFLEIEIEPLEIIEESGADFINEPFEIGEPNLNELELFIFNISDNAL